MRHMMQPSSSPEATASPPRPTMLTPDSDSADSGPVAAARPRNGDGGTDCYEMERVGKRGKRGRLTRGAPRRMRQGTHGMGADGRRGAGYGGEEGDARRARDSREEAVDVWDAREEAAVVRKFDRRLVLFVAFLYMLSFLDRSNIGNAKIAGLGADLRLTSDQYEWLLTAFYLSYIAFEWMSVLWKTLPAHAYVTAIVLSWGVVASLQSVVTTFPGLFLLRLCLGIGEAGFTGIPYYLSFFYRRDELALRTGLFISAAPLATSFASSLGYLIVLGARRAHVAPWRVLFLVEGFPSVVASLFTWTQIPDGPGDAAYLSARQATIARRRLTTDRGPVPRTSPGRAAGSRARALAETVRDPKTWMTALMFFCANTAFSSLPSYLPQILSDMGHSVEAAQALSAPPYLLAFASVLGTAYVSDRTRTRSTPIILHALVSAAGYALLAAAGRRGWSDWLRYAAIYPAAVGFFSAITIIITWNVNNQREADRQGVGFAVLQMVGQCGPLLGTRLYPARDAPLYTRGMLICAGAMLAVAALAAALRCYLARENARGLVAYESVGDDEAEDEAELAATGAAMKRFVYMI